MLISTTTFAQDFKLKAATNFEHLDIGAEIHMQSYNPNGFGVFGVDLQDGLPMFNMGYNYHFKYSEVMLFTGVGLQKYKYESDTNRLISSAVSSQGCSNGRGRGVQQNCSNSSGNSGNGNGNGNNNGNGNGNSGGNNGNGGGSSSPTASAPSANVAGSYIRETVVQELGVRIVPKIDSRFRPMLELNTSTANAGFDFEQTMKIGVVFDL